MKKNYFSVFFCMLGIILSALIFNNVLCAEDLTVKGRFYPLDMNDRFAWSEDGNLLGFNGYQKMGTPVQPGRNIIGVFNISTKETEVIGGFCVIDFPQ